MEQQSMGRNVAPLGRSILISSQTVCITPQCYVLSREAEYIYFIVCGFIRPGLKPKITLTITPSLWL
jgi:hypothetical protein